MWRLFNSMRDMYSNVTLILAAVIVIVLTQVNPPAVSNPAIKPPGSIAVSIAWQQGPVDVDLWVTGPGQDKATGYSNRSGKLFSLLRDDLGTAGDTSPVNMENAFARETPAGEFVINVHCYSCSGLTTVHVEVALGSNADNMHLLVNTDLELRPKQERTVVRFRLDADGRVVPGSVNSVYRELRSAGK